MRVRPANLDNPLLAGVLRQHWGFEAAELRYSPVGYGSHHWLASTTTGERRFVTVDELIPEDATWQLRRLRAAMRSAVALREEAGLEFVVAPLASAGGEVVVSLHDNFAVAMLPFVDGNAWTNADPAARVQVAGLLARLHEATAVTAPFALNDDLALDARTDLEAALGSLHESGCSHETWRAGPYSAGCRVALAASATGIRDALKEYDALVTACLARAAPRVLTHGEPKPDNLLATDSGPVLVDWDTALLAPPARDLWWLADSTAALDGYAAATGRSVPADDIALYRLRWTLTDIALFVRQLRAPHTGNADTEIAWRVLQQLLEGIRQS